MVDYTPATDIQIQTYQLIQSGTAFDTSPQQYAAALSTSVNDLITVLTKLGGTTLVPTGLTDASTTFQALSDHLSDHYTNLIDNLGLVSSAISDSIGYGVIGTTGAPAGSVDDPAASYPSFFGSIMGSSNTYVAQAANQVGALMAQAGVIMCGTILTQVISSGNTTLIAAIAPLNTYENLTIAMANINPTTLGLFGTAMTNLGALLSDPSQNSEFAGIDEIVSMISALGL